MSRNNTASVEVSLDDVIQSALENNCSSEDVLDCLEESDIASYIQEKMEASELAEYLGPDYANDLYNGLKKLHGEDDEPDLSKLSMSQIAAHVELNLAHRGDVSEFINEFPGATRRTMYSVLREEYQHIAGTKPLIFNDHELAWIHDGDGRTFGVVHLSEGRYHVSYKQQHNGEVLTFVAATLQMVEAIVVSIMYNDQARV